MLDTIVLFLFKMFVVYQFLYQVYWYLLSPKFSDKTVMITGASSGIGEQLAKMFVQKGATKLILTARRMDQLERVKKLCLGISPTVLIELVKMDQSKPEECLKIIQEGDYGFVDILINNAGVSQRDQFTDCDFEVAKYMMNVNCLGPIAIIKGILNQNRQPRKQIVNILSISGIMGVPCRTFYCASKFGLDGFAKALQAETLDNGVSVTNIYPAYVKTELSKNAILGTGEKLGSLDSNIGQGLSVEEACLDIMKAIYLKRYWIIIGSLYYQIGPKLCYLSETVNKMFSKSKYKSQLKVLEKAKTKAD